MFTKIQNSNSIVLIPQYTIVGYCKLLGGLKNGKGSKGSFPRCLRNGGS